MEELIKEASPRTVERLWLIEHFRILPTDERYTRLSDTQVSVLVNNWLNMPDEYEMKRSYWEKKLKTIAANPPPVDQLREIGYSDEEIRKIQAECNGGQ